MLIVCNYLTQVWYEMCFPLLNCSLTVVLSCYVSPETFPSSGFPLSSSSLKDIAVVVNLLHCINNISQ